MTIQIDTTIGRIATEYPLATNLPVSGLANSYTSSETLTH